ncbi:MAG: S41 family peptidase, partial [Pseudomonadota bacterium]
AINAFLGLSADDHTKLVLLDPLAKKLKDQGWEMRGIGAQFDFIPEGLRVTNVAQKSPAADAGIIPADIITALDGRKINKNNYPEISDLLQGTVTNTFQLFIKREGQELKKEIQSTLMKVQYVQSSAFSFKGKKMGYFSVPTLYSNNICAQSRKVLENFLQQEKVDGLIMDLRGNRGGLMDETICLAELFLPPKTPLAKPIPVSEDFKSYAREVYRTEKSPLVPNKIPLVILVDDFTGSGGELLAGALADYTRAILIGVRTHGKATIQALFDYPAEMLEGGKLGLYRTVAVYSLPKSGSFQLVGIKPHLTVANPLRAASDPELREEDYTFRPTAPLRKGPVSYLLEEEVSKCQEQRGLADKNFKQKDVTFAFDYQLLKAQDILGCLLKVL